MCWLVMQAADGNRRSGVVCSAEGKQKFCLFLSADLRAASAICVVTSRVFFSTSGKDVIHPVEGRTTLGVCDP